MTKQFVFSGLGLFVLALLVRLPYLGTFMTIDEVKWLEGTGQFLLGLYNGHLTDTYWHFHPGITITWGETILLWLQYLVSGNSDLTAFVTDHIENLANVIGPMRLSPVIITSLTVAGIYWLARPLLGNWSALLGAGLLAVDPFFAGHSRIVNGDAGTAGFMMLAFLAFAHLWQSQRWQMALLAGVMAGLALLTKLPAPIILPWVVVLAGLGFIKDRCWQPWLKSLLIFGVATIVTFVVLWPTMWVAPVDTLRLMFHDSFRVGEAGAGHDTFFLGQISDDPGWLFYPYAIAFRLTPLTIIGVLAAFLWLRGGRTNDEVLPWKTMLVGSLIFYIVFVYLFANLSPKKLDRYVMAVIPALTLLAGVGWDWVINEILSLTAAWSSLWRSLVLTMPLILIAIQATFTISNYPYILTYYNPLLGGYARASQQVPVGWGEGLEQAAAWINTQPNAANLLVSTWYSDMVRPYLRSGTASFSSSGKGQLTADYVIFYINQKQRQKPNSAVVNYFNQRDPVFQVDYHGTPYTWIYAAPHMQVEVSGNTKIEGRATLLGYSWHPEPPTKDGQAATLTLFMHTLGILPDNETFVVSLASAEGTLWGEWQPSDQVDWQPDAIIEWTGTLRLPDDMPPGDYQLVIRLMDTNLDSEVTRFPLEEAVVNLAK
jgi:4-amino-4-deoxy-L-arabinose transferase-like glycosyltransferase